jgi:ferrochelatase
LPLYPQFSTTTTQSAFDDWDRAAAAAGLTAPARRVCCYPVENGWISALAARTRAAVAAAPDMKRRYLFSAHGLPRKIVDGGDPYQWQVEQTSAALAAALELGADDWAVCYQSRVGPLEWIGPSLDDEIKRAADDGIAVAVVPVAFVSEHSETLVELDIEYRKVADELGIPSYVRAPTVDDEEMFIAGLAGLVEASLERPAGLESGSGGRICPDNWRRCPCLA